MADPVEDARVWSPEEVAEVTGEAEEEDESGAPERVAETADEHPLESPEALREPRDESGEEQLRPSYLQYKPLDLASDMRRARGRPARRIPMW